MGRGRGGQAAVGDCICPGTQVMNETATDDAAVTALASLDLNAFDLDGDGEIDWKEFVAGCLQDHDLYNEDNLDKVLWITKRTTDTRAMARVADLVWMCVQVFQELDTDKSGTLSISEIGGMLGNDHELRREILAKLQEERKGQPIDSLEEMHMTLEVCRLLWVLVQHLMFISCRVVLVLFTGMSPRPALATHPPNISDTCPHAVLHPSIVRCQSSWLILVAFFSCLSFRSSRQFC